MASLLSLLAEQIKREAQRKVRRTLRDGLVYAVAGLLFLTCYLFATVALFLWLSQDLGAVIAALAVAGMALVTGIFLLVLIDYVQTKRHRRDVIRRGKDAELLKTGATLGALSSSPGVILAAGAGLLALGLMTRRMSSEQD